MNKFFTLIFCATLIIMVSCVPNSEHLKEKMQSQKSKHVLQSYKFKRSADIRGPLPPRGPPHLSNVPDDIGPANHREPTEYGSPPNKRHERLPDLTGQLSNWEHLNNRVPPGIRGLPIQRGNPNNIGFQNMREPSGNQRIYLEENIDASQRDERRKTLDEISTSQNAQKNSTDNIDSTTAKTSTTFINDGTDSVTISNSYLGDRTSEFRRFSPMFQAIAVTPEA